MKRILIADDQPHVARILRLALERQGYQVRSVFNGLEALEQIRQDPPDLLITDIEMPRMNGRQLCMTLQEEQPQRTFPILIITSRTGHSERQWAHKIDQAEFLEKPLSIKQLITRLAIQFQDSSGAERPGDG